MTILNVHIILTYIYVLYVQSKELQKMEAELKVKSAAEKNALKMADEFSEEVLSLIVYYIYIAVVSH